MTTEFTEHSTKLLIGATACADKYYSAQEMLAIVMEVIRHAELIVENSFGRSSTPTVHLIIQNNVLPITGFIRHTKQTDEARDGRNIALNYQLNCWCARSSKETILLCLPYCIS